MRLIDADRLLEVFDPNTWQGDMMISVVNNSPTIEKRATRKRIEPEAPKDKFEIECTLCNGMCFATDLYCASCGAKMEK